MLIHLISLAVLLTPLLSFVPGIEPSGNDGPPTGTWQLDPARSTVRFTVTKLGFADVTGQFLDFSGTVRHDTANPHNSSVQWTVKVASVKTDEHRRDQTLRAPEYFDAHRFPEMSFRSDRVRAIGGNRLQVDGHITIKGQVRPMSVTAVPVDGGFETHFELNRFDYGIVGGMVMRTVIGRTVRINLVAVAAQEE